MKRIVSMLLSLGLAFAFVLSGCTVDPVGNTTDANTTEGTHNGNYGLDLSDTDGWAVVANSALYGTVVDDGYYYQTENGFLAYLDMNVGTSVILCSKVACEHRDETCEAFLPDAATRKLMFYWNDDLYYIESDADGASLLLRRDSAGMAKEKVARLGESLMGTDRQVFVADIVMAGGWLYYHVEIFVVSKTADGGIVSVIDNSYLCRINLKSGKDMVLVEYTGGNLKLVTARADAMIYVEYDAPDVDIQFDDTGMPVYPDGYYEALANSPANLMRWDEATGQSTLLLERTNGTLYAPKSYGGKVVFVDDDNERRYAYDIKTGEVVELDMINGSIINETYMIHAESGVQTLKNMETGKEYPIELAGMVIRLYNRSDKWLILTLIKNDGTRESYYIPMSAIGDGIQKTELVSVPS